MLEDFLHELSVHPWIRFVSFQPRLLANESVRVSSLTCRVLHLGAFLGWTDALRTACSSILTVEYCGTEPEGPVFRLLVVSPVNAPDVIFLQPALLTLREVPC